MKRRNLLVAAAAALAAALAGGVAALAGVVVRSASRLHLGRVSSWIPLCRAEEVTDEAPLAKEFTFQRRDGWYDESVTRQLYVTRQSEGVVVFSRSCTHTGCSVKWRSELGRYRCPCHGAEFEADGTVSKGPADRPLERHASREGDGVIEVELA